MGGAHYLPQPALPEVPAPTSCSRRRPIPQSMFADMTIEELRRQIEHFCGLGDRVIDQARRRVLFGEQVATDEKIYSIFEPHTDLIKRGKA